MKKLSLVKGTEGTESTTTATADPAVNAQYEVDPMELKRRTDFLKAQRDKLLAMKRARLRWTLHRSAVGDGRLHRSDRFGNWYPARRHHHLPILRDLRQGAGRSGRHEHTALLERFSHPSHVILEILRAFPRGVSSFVCRRRCCCRR